MEILTALAMGAVYVAGPGPLAVARFAAFCRARLKPRSARAFSRLCGLALIAFGLQLGLTAAVQATRAAQTNFRLNAPLAPDDDLYQNWLSPDGQTVLYTVWSAAADTVDLYIAPLDGSEAPRRVNEPLQPDDRVSDPAFSPDGTRVFYLQTRGSFGPTDLYVVPLDGSTAPLRINDPLPTGSSGVRDFLISPDGATVVLSGELDQADVLDLYSLPADGSGAPLKLNGPMVALGNVVDFLLSPDGSRVVFRADYRVSGVFELDSVPTDGSAPPVRLNGPLVANGVVQSDYAITPDGARVVFRADALVNDLFEIASVPIDRSQPPVRLNDTLVAGGDVDSFLITPDSSRVIYRADDQTANVHELLSVPTDRSLPPVRLNNELQSWADVSGNYQVTADSSRVLFLADQEDDSLTELFSAPVAGGQPAMRLNAPLVNGGIVYHFSVSPDGARVVYSADQDTDEIVELYTLVLDGSPVPQKLNGPIAAGAEVRSAFNFSPDGAWIAYRTGPGGVADTLQLVAADGAAAPVTINPPLVEYGEIEEVSEGFSAQIIAAPGPELRLLYYADQEADEQFELFVTHLTPPVLHFNAAAATVAEAATVVTATVQLDGAVLSPVQVGVALGGDASAGSDYLLAPGALTFARGESSQILEITILPDDELEGDETLIVTLHNPQNAVLAAPHSFALTILDDDEEGGGPDPYPVYLPLFTNNQANP